MPTQDVVEVLRESLGLAEPAHGHEAESLHRILILRLKGFSLGLIANILNSEEFPTKFGKQWTPHAVRIVLLKFAASPAQQAQVRDMGQFTAAILKEIEEDMEARRRRFESFNDPNDPVTVFARLKETQRAEAMQRAEGMQRADAIRAKEVNHDP
jgi:DNA-binding transcriptional MerR regulator